jgi:hypothetical protein
MELFKPCDLKDYESMETTRVLYKFSLKMYPSLMEYSLTNLIYVSVSTELYTVLKFPKL